MSRSNEFPDLSAEQKLDSLFSQYREACAPPEGGVNFLPEIWEKIESRKRFTLSLRKLAQSFVVASAAACMLIGGLLVSPLVQSPPYPGSYVEVLADEQSPDHLLFQDVALADTAPEFAPASWDSPEAAAPSR